MRSEKRVLVVMVFIVVALFSSLVVGNAAAQVQGGKHDLSLGGTSIFQTDTFEVCVFCHTPHGGNTNQGYQLNPATDNTNSSEPLNGQFLWNRKVPAPTSWLTYSNPATMNHIVGNPGKLSLLCLSCHDGIGAINVLLNYPTNGQPNLIGIYNQFGDAALTDTNIGPLNIGGAVCTGGLETNCNADTGNDLRNDHPIGFAYLPNASAVDPGLYDLDAIKNPEVLKRMQTITGGRMECSSCHDPHLTNKGNPGNMFLVTLDNSGSKLCFACHNK